MNRDDNTQGTGGAGTGSGGGSSSGSGSGNSGGGAGTGSGRLKLVAAVLAVVVGLALLVAPLVDRWADPSTRPAFYLAALLAVYAVCTHATARRRRT